MRVIGVDPGSRLLGWGVIEGQGTRLVHLAHGTLAVQGEQLADRLLYIDDHLREVVAEHAPEQAAVEDMFFAKNARSAAVLGHARGVVLLCLRRAGLQVAEYPPARVKRTVVGRGRADKRQVAQVVAAVLGLGEVPQSDAADALAVAITHLGAAHLGALLSRR